MAIVSGRFVVVLRVSLSILSPSYLIATACTLCCCHVSIALSLALCPWRRGGRPWTLGPYNTRKRPCLSKTRGVRERKGGTKGSQERGEKERNRATHLAPINPFIHRPVGMRKARGAAASPLSLMLLLYWLEKEEGSKGV